MLSLVMACAMAAQKTPTLIASEKPTFDEARRLAGLGRYGAAENLLRGLKSPVARARWALLISADDPAMRDRGVKEFHPEEAGRIAAELRPVLVAGAAVDPECSRILSSIYAFGVGVEIDHEESARWIRKAIVDGSVRANLILGQMHLSGQGVKKDAKTAAALVRKAADDGDTLAMVVLGNLYYEGEGIKQDRAKAMELFTRSAKAGDIDGMLACSMAYGDKSERASELGDTIIAGNHALAKRRWEQYAADAGCVSAKAFIDASKDTAMDLEDGLSKAKALKKQLKALKRK